MGGQQSRPQLLGVSGGGGGFGKIAEVGGSGKIAEVGGSGKIAEALAPKVAFDTNTGELVVAGTGKPDVGNGMRLNLNQTGGWSAVALPTDGVDLGQYIDNIAKYMNQGQLQNPGVYPMTVNMMAFDAIGTQVGVESIGQPSGGFGGNPAGAKVLPMVTVYQIKNPPVRAVVYTDKAGVSKFLYKNDPGNAVQLVPNGSRIAAGASQKGLTSTQADAAGMNECEKFRKMMAMCGNPTQVSAAAPAPAMGTSTYAVQGEMYPIQVSGGGYPTWLIILIIAILTGVLIFVKNS